MAAKISEMTCAYDGAISFFHDLCSPAAPSGPGVVLWVLRFAFELFEKRRARLQLFIHIFTTF